MSREVFRFRCRPNATEDRRDIVAVAFEQFCNGRLSLGAEKVKAARSVQSAGRRRAMREARNPLLCTWDVQ